MSSFSSSRVSSRMNHRDKSVRAFRFLVIIAIFFIALVSYLVWSVGSITVPAKKYTIEK